MTTSPKEQAPGISTRRKKALALKAYGAGLMLALGLACPASLPAASFEIVLKMEQTLKHRAYEAPELASSQPMAEEVEDGFSLKPDKGSRTAPPVLPPAQTHPIGFPTGRHLWRTLLHLFLLASSLFLLAHIAREWGKVLLVRLRREQKPTMIEHANWPIVSILVVPKGDAPAQERRYDALRNLPFDYPPERIHFVAAYHAEDLGVRDAIHRLGKALPEKVHPLPIAPGDDAHIAALLPQALACSVGTALVILDQALPVPRDWLKTALSPLLDPAIGVVLNRTVPDRAGNALVTRLIALGDHADVLLANQADAMDLMLCGKARLLALRRSAYKSIEDKTADLTPDGASIVLELIRMGWQASLLPDIQGRSISFTGETIRSPRLHPRILLQSLRLTSLAFSSHYPQGARKQGQMVFFAAILPVAWLANLLLGLLLYASGDILTGGLALMLCAATSFDPLGHPKPAFSLAASARMAGIRTEIRILPLSCLSFMDRMIEGCRESIRLRRPIRSSALKHGDDQDPVLFDGKGEAA